jgi:hypothetical protein
MAAANGIAANLVQITGAETIALSSSNGADTITVSNLTGTGIQQVNSDVSTYGNVETSADTVIVEGTPNADDLSYVKNDKGGLDSDGLSYNVSLISLEVTHDTAVLRGGAGDDILSTGPGVEDVAMIRLEGQSGDDLLLGTTRGDTLNGGSENDTMTGGTGTDMFLGGAGTDRIVEVRDANFALTDTTLVIGSEGTDSVTSVEESMLTGGPGANAFTISGWTGFDQLDGAGAGDSYTINMNGTRGATTIQDTGTTGTDSALVNPASFDAPFIASGTQLASGSESVTYDRNLELLSTGQVGTAATYSSEHTLSVTPSSDTLLNFTGRPRVAPSDPMNLLNFDLTLVTQPVLTVTGPRSGVLTSQSHGSVTYTEFEQISGSGRTFDLVVDAASTGWAGNKGDGTGDNFSARLDGDILRIYANGLLVFSADADSVGTVFIRGSSDDDTLVLDNSSSTFPGTFNFDGVSGAVDTLEIIGDGFATGYYVPGAVYGSGTVGYSSSSGLSQLVTFTNLTPVIVHDFTSYTFVTPESADVIAVDSPAS